ncbi:MAG: Lrp/AsnC family transcriptional regulator [Myxococcales bacterium]|nr:Lrp/AsnC family transcriptional regulator [Myxococcales bacterium]
MAFDATDQAILHELQTNGKVSNTALAAKVHLSESACLRRVQRLEKSGLIQGYAALVSQSAVGFPDNVFVRITLHSQQQQDLAAFEAEALNIPEVMECYLMTGDADYLLRVIVGDARDYERIHSLHLTRLPGVARVQSSFALRTVIKRSEIPVHFPNGPGSG